MTITDDDRQFLLGFVRRHAALAIEPAQEYLLATRLAPVLAQHQLRGLPQLVARLRVVTSTDPLVRDLTDALTTNETSFFREPHVFDALTSDVLPRLARARPGRSLTLWSAACSSGQEAVSLAIAIRERVPDLTGWRVRIVGSDLSSRMVARAKAGRFTAAEVRRGLPPDLLARYFVPIPAGAASGPGEYQVRRELLGELEFHPGNLLTDPGPAGGYDLVLLRNVLIYFDDGARRRVLDNVLRGLAADGAVVLGASELTTHPELEFVRSGRIGLYQPRQRLPRSAEGR
ncbi:MAG: protein-glutamate O-methyltransferase CheR [Kofleriaceae bacterium]|nr:protein-glutamate O-methyltransferase CheR [Kofleriaceae bacterium]MBP6838976.1 protein-glutamate O-methyltransferase CheR [Kofleriaceae bacterium]